MGEIKFALVNSSEGRGVRAVTYLYRSIITQTCERLDRKAMQGKKGSSHSQHLKQDMCLTHSFKSVSEFELHTVMHSEAHLTTSCGLLNKP